MEGLLALIVVGLVVASTSWFQRQLERRVVAALADLTGGRVEVKSFRFHPWLLQATLEGFTIHGTEPAGQPPLVSVRHVEVRLNPDQLLRRQLRFHSMDVDELRVHLYTASDGSTNLPGFYAQISPQAGLDNLLALSIGHLTVSHSAFSWNDLQYPLELDARELAVLLRMTGHRYTGTLSSSGALVHSSRWALPPVTFAGRFELARTGLTVSSFSWQAQGVSGGGSFVFHPRPAPESYASFGMATDLAALSRILRVPELRGGSLQIQGQAIYRHGDLFAQGIAHARQAAFSAPPFSVKGLDATTDFTVRQGKIALPNLAAAVWGGTVQAKLQADLANVPGSIRATAQLRGLQLEGALRAVTSTPLLLAHLSPAAIVDGSLNSGGAGKLEKPETTFDLTLRPPVSIPHRFVPIRGHARGTLEVNHGWTLHLASGEFETPHSKLSAAGSVVSGVSPSRTAQSLAIKAVTTSFEEWRPVFQELLATNEPIPLTLLSPAELSGQISGTGAEPSLEGRVRMGQFQYQGWTWDRLEAGLAVRPGWMEISSGRMEHGRSALALSGSAQLDHWQVTANSHVHLSAEAQKTPLDGLHAAVNSSFPIHGFVTGHLDVDGTAASLAGSGWLRIESGAVGNEPFDSLTAQIQVVQSRWKMQAIHLTKAQGHLDGELAFEPLRRFFSGQFAGTDFRLSQIESLTPASTAIVSKNPLDGQLSFQVQGEGTPDAFHLKGAWQVSNFSVAGTSLGGLTGILSGEQQRLRIEGENRGPAGSWRFVARTTAAGDWPVEVDGQYSAVHVDPWVRAFFNRAFEATVIVDGSFHATGPLRNPDQIDARAEVRNLAVRFPSLDWKNDQPIDMSYHGATLTLNRFVMRGPSTELAVQGAVHCANRITLALSAEGKADAALLSALDPKLQATGRSVLHLRVAGEPARPLLNGSLEVQEVSLAYGDMPFRFSNLEGTVQLDGERATLRSVRGVSGGGRVTLGGSVTLQGTPRYNLQADFNQVRVRYPPNFTSVLDGNLHIAGNSERGQLRGDWIVRQMSVNQNANFISRIIESSAPFGEQPQTVSSPAASRVRMNVRVTSPAPVHVETQDVRLVADIDVHLQGTLANPVQVGSIHLLSGEGVFRGNRYTLTRGDISLTNPFHTQASLDLEARTRVQTYQLTLLITGPFERLKLAYRSDPPLSTNDIVSLLALGYVKENNALSTTSLNPARSVGASAILSEALSSQVTGRIQRLFGVSRIKIDPNVGLPGYGSGARVTVEQQVTRDLTLTYVTDTSASQYRIIQFEWVVSDTVSVLGVRDPNGIFGVEFRFRHRFK